MTAYLDRVRQLSEGQPSLRVRARSRFEPVPPDAEPPWERAAAAIPPPSPGTAAEVPGAAGPPEPDHGWPGMFVDGRFPRLRPGLPRRIRHRARRRRAGCRRAGCHRAVGLAGRAGPGPRPHRDGDRRTPADDATAGGGIQRSQDSAGRARRVGPAMRSGARALTRPARLSRPASPAGGGGDGSGRGRVAGRGRTRRHA